ncbi:MAG TPA: hypothetical protein VIY48_14340 [Candidatus Paceibacterota bacterium]
MDLNELSEQIHDTAIKHGWWKENRNFGEVLALIHSEVSEVLEDWRNGMEFHAISMDEGKPTGIPIEMADILIRVLDACAGLEINIQRAVEIKMAYNQGRPYRHGGKIA